MLPDLRFAFRTLRRSPIFTLVAVLSLGLGIGANTAIFSLIDAVLLKSLPVRSPEALRTVEPINRRGEADTVSYPLYRLLRDDHRVFSDVYAASSGTSEKELGGSPAGGGSEKVIVEMVSGEYFPVLGVNAVAGRLIALSDSRTGGADPVAVVSYRFWNARLGRDYGVLSQTVSLDGQPLRIIGVAAPEFFGDAVGEAPDFWVPAEMQPLFDRGASMLESANSSWLRVMGRLRPDLNDAQAQAGMALLLEQSKASGGAAGRSMEHYRGFRLGPGARGFSKLRARFSQPLRIVMGIVGLLLLIACANVANLLLARASGRQKEIAIRLAIGAGRWRLVRQMLTESLLLAGAGGALGVLLALWGSRALLMLVSGGGAAVPVDLRLDAGVLGFTIATSLTTGLLFGLLPALASTRPNVSPTLKGSTGMGIRSTLLRPLVVLQVAVSLLLVTGAGLFVRTLRNLRSLDLGFAAEHVVQVWISPESSGYRPDQLVQLQSRVAGRLRSTPGVLAVGMAGSGFRSGNSRTCCIAVEGYRAGVGEDRQIRTNPITPEYFSTMGMRLLAGRGLGPEDATDREETVRTAVVSEAFARYYYGSGNAVGRRFGWGDPPKVKYGFEIVGVVQDAIWGEMRDGAPRMVYFPAKGGDLIAVRVGMDPAAMVRAVRAAIRQEDPNLRIDSLETLPFLKDQALAQENLIARLATFFGSVALLLAGLGLYGVMSYGVVRRKQEIGIRMALGAQSGHVLWMVLREAGLLVAVGAAVGLPAALAGGRLVASQLFGVRVADPLTIGVSAAVLVAVAAVAAWLPARRATLVDPTVALRYE
jgi:predicted permease